MRMHDLCSITRHGLIILRYEYQKEHAKYLVTILPWRKYVYLKMPPGLNISTDVFQRELSRLFQGIPFVLVYIDNILIITKGTFE